MTPIVKHKAQNLILTVIIFIAFFVVSCNKNNDTPGVGTKVGDIAPEFSLKNADNELVSLSDYKGQLVLVEFCASWCSYCKAEFPELELIYDDYKDKGFEIISLSIDEDRDAWLKMISDYNMQYVCVNDPEGFDSPSIEAYGVETIPRMYLISESGIIVYITTKADEVRVEVSKRL